MLWSFADGFRIRFLQRSPSLGLSSMMRRVVPMPTHTTVSLSPLPSSRAFFQTGLYPRLGAAKVIRAEEPCRGSDRVVRPTSLACALRFRWRWLAPAMRHLRGCRCGCGMKGGWLRPLCGWNLVEPSLICGMSRLCVCNE